MDSCNYDPNIIECSRCGVFCQYCPLESYYMGIIKTKPKRRVMKRFLEESQEQEQYMLYIEEKINRGGVLSIENRC